MITNGLSYFVLCVNSLNFFVKFIDLLNQETFEFFDGEFSVLIIFIVESVIWIYWQKYLVVREMFNRILTYVASEIFKDVVF